MTDVDLAFLVGCGRSGTTWLQGMLATHPGVATSRETQLFAEYLSRVRDRWDYDARKLEFGSSAYAVGLPTIVSRGEFLGYCRQFSERVYEQVLASEPGATVLLDKTPNHLHEAAFILEVFPDARFINIVRDPRAVVNSLLRAAEGWGSYWAPRSPIDAARRWLNAVLAYEELTKMPAEVKNVRYEDLHADGPDMLLRLWHWLDLEAEVDAAREAHRTCAIEQWRAKGETFLSTNERREVPDGFYREGRTDSWRDELSSHEVAVVEAICGEHMGRFGYAATGTTNMARLRIESKRYIKRFHAKVGARIDSLLGRL